MSQKSIQSSSPGFTIIEVLIVLAIAALIILIVLLAVPALQRSQRNNARKTDAGRVSAAVIDFVSNSVSNSFPITQTDCTNVMTAADQANLAQFNGLGNTAALCPGAVNTPPVGTPPKNKFYIYTPGAPTVLDMSAKLPTSTQNSQMVLATQAKCDPTDPTKTSITGATATNAALLYSVETGNSWTYACVNVQ